MKKHESPEAGERRMVMKLKSILGAVLAGALTLGSTMAFAQSGPIYLTPKLLYSHQMIDSFNGSLGSAENVFDADYNGPDKTDNVFGGGVAIGYDFGAVGYAPVRTELEFLARGESEADYKNQIVGRSLGQNIFASHSLKSKVYTLFANVYYDFANDSAVTPYIGGGIGGAYIDSNYSSLYTSNALRAGSMDANGSQNCWNFAWNLGGGLAYQISDTMAFDLGYRYSDFGQVDTGGTPKQWLTDSAGNTYALRAKGKADMSAHEVILGLRISGY